MTNKDSSEKKIIPITPIEDDRETIAMYAPEKKIYPRSVSGYFSNIRWIMVWVTQIIFYGLPWLEWGQRQAVLFDLGTRRFYIFGLVLYPQDLIYFASLLIISAFSLFLFTAVAGRLWCGYSCPQTVYTEIFLWIEKQVCGDRSAHIRSDAESWSFKKISRKGLKHFLWISFSLYTGFTFVGYFTPIKELSTEIYQLNLGAWEVFWVFFYGLATYGNAGFLREQICKHMCPYARFQSAMFDKDTLVVAYDQARGDPRGARSRKADPVLLNLGSCVDCNLCVQVCPTGIDIRNGLQYECIGCGACADVCDTVMDKMGYERGLIKYATENSMLGGWSKQQIWKRIFRPRVLIYTGLLALIVGGLIYSLNDRKPFKVDVVRDRGVMARVVEGGKIENVYRLQIMNATEQIQHYSVTVSGLDGLEVVSDNHLEVGPAESRWMVLRALLPADAAEPGSHKIKFRIFSIDMEDHDSEKSTFIVPRN
ncbi:cytochrome c oxidase accessory protein CcoG [Rhodoferax sp.]|uniref:cytochrome c oxidase accessory protein CcoG n=1 Tax=Rhodoferax sp. TaxID=50421 RepID=UPI00260F5C7D|nr:cytochrome c oxidase accessory protein CcoG [Rhodoferax sp.]MDD2808901.1 cytochrome c oxidase accessory protein CcoG [Rhodoferax sp.]MDD4943501.1 cytochrome c oxidase accessory protein CcoG [Rhodoferax sp.]